MYIERQKALLKDITKTISLLYCICVIVAFPVSLFQAVTFFDFYLRKCRALLNFNLKIIR